MDRLNKKSKRVQDSEKRSAYSIHWNTGLFQAPCADPGCCCISIFCSQCVSYNIRKRILYGDMSRYVCCAGHCPCSGKCGESSCPEFCLCMEVFCCFSQSVASSRFVIQDERRIENTACDNCLIGFMICMQYVAYVFRIAACITQIDIIEQLADIMDCIADLAYCSVCACMQTQHKVELDVRDGKKPPKEGCAGPGGGGVMTSPPMQQQMGYGAPPPQNYGVPPQGYGGPPQAYGVPQAYAPPPPQPYGVPPQAYPPQAYPPPQGYA